MMPTIDYDSDNFDDIYELEVGEVFRYTKNPETLLKKIADNIPSSLTTFTVRLIRPGTDYFTVHGANTCVVTEKEAS